jgi:hypothetical protein
MLYSGLSLKHVEKIQDFFKSGKNIRHFMEIPNNVDSDLNSSAVQEISHC